MLTDEELWEKCKKGGSITSEDLGSTNMKDATKEELETVDNYIKSISKSTGVNFFDEKDIFEKLKDSLMNYFDINNDTYAYNLTRDKKAFSVDTMTFDDFEEFSEETIDDIIKYIKENM